MISGADFIVELTCIEQNMTPSIPITSSLMSLEMGITTCCSCSVQTKGPPLMQDPKSTCPATPSVGTGRQARQSVIPSGELFAGHGGEDMQLAL
jgi:hypothetical protein